MKKSFKTICQYKSNKEQEIYVGSGFCKRCPHFNGTSTRKRFHV